MNKILLIIQREYITRVKKKTFIISTILFPLLYLGLIFGIGYLGESGKKKLNVAFIDQHDLAANFFYLFHSVSAEYYSRTFLRQLIDLIFDKIGIYRVQATKRFVKYDQLRFVQYCSNELKLLAHTF